MNSVIDNALVVFLVLASMLYAVAALSPRPARRRWAARIAACLARAPSSLHLTSAAQRLVRAADEKAAGACGGCDNCGSEARPQQQGNAEIRVPIAHIARRSRQS